MADLQKTGVEAVVEGLASFLSDVDSMNSKIGEIGSKGNILTRALGGAWEMLGNLGESIVNVAEYALGQLLADAIEFVIGKLGELASATIEAGAQFQLMELRLNRLNFNTAMQGTNSYTTAMLEATEATQEQLTWVQKLAVTTPYDAQDIANIYTLAQSYGFAATAGQDLGNDLNYLANQMGLTDEQTEKLSTSIGNMTQKGSLLGYELDSIKRMGFPVGDMLEDMRAEAGMTSDEFLKFMRTGEGVNAFLKEFQGLIGTTAQTLTQDITDFAAGMGLGNTEIERIIVNFGQMQQQGKVTQRELNDLARGSFVPVNDILDIMREKTGLAGDAFDDFRNSAEGVNLFMESFSELVETRFRGAAEDMAKTFKGATDNAQDFIKSLIGFGVVRPVLGAIGESIANVITELTKEENWERMTAAAGRIGDTIASMIRSFSNLGGGAKPLADTIVGGLERIADWIDENRLKILKFFVDMKAKILEIWDALKRGDALDLMTALGLSDKAMGFILKLRDNITEAFDTIKKWVDSNGPLIEQFFETLGEIIKEVFAQLSGDVQTGGGLEGFLNIVRGVMEWIIENQVFITRLVTVFTELWLILQLVGFAFALIGPPIIALLGFLISLGALVVFVGSVISLLLSPIGLLIVAIVALVAAWQYWGADAVRLIEFVKFKIGEFFGYVTLGFQYVGQVIAEWLANVQLGFAYVGQVIMEWGVSAGQAISDFVITGIESLQTFLAGATEKFTGLWNEFTSLVNRIVSKVTNTNWAGIGASIIEGMIDGVVSMVGALMDAVGNAVSGAIEAAQEALNARSPSKVFMEIGAGTMEGMAIGIQKMAGVAARSMESAIAGVTMPAMAGVGLAARGGTTNNTYNQNYALTINSSATRESVLQDYGMMQSLAGG